MTRSAVAQPLRRQRGSCLIPALLGALGALCLPRLPSFVGGLIGAAPSTPRGTSRAASFQEAGIAADANLRKAADSLKNAKASAAAKVQGAVEAVEDAEASAAAKVQGVVEAVEEGTVNLLEKRDRDQAKEQLLGLLEEEGLAEELMSAEGNSLRGRVDELISLVERTSPTREPVYSDLLDGEWRVKLSGSYAPGLFQSPTRELALFLYAGGFSPGNALGSFSNGFWGKLLGVQAENYRVTIRGGGADVESSAEITTFGQRQTVSYKAELMPLSPNRMSEEILSLELPSPIGNQEPPLALRRQLLVSYLDEDMMIARDESGVADVLIRESNQAAAGASISAAVASDTRDPLSS